MAYKSLLPLQSKAPKSQNRSGTELEDLHTVLMTHLRFSTIISIGAILQGLIVLLIPRFWALAPSMVVLALKIADSMAVTYKLKSSPYTKDAFMHRATALVPNTDGEFPPVDGSGGEKVAVLMLGIKLNHPLGVFAPHVATVNKFQSRMGIELDTNREENGFLGQSLWTSHDQNGSLEMMLLSYWRSIEDVHAFAHGPLHKEAWHWFEQSNAADPEAIRHIGISHEVFEAPKGKWESVYLNYQASRLGATSYLRRGDKEIGGVQEDAWMSPLVDASKGRLRTHLGRL